MGTVMRKVGSVTEPTPDEQEGMRGLNISERVRSVSVEYLVRMRLGKEPDNWKLAVVQRDRAWDEHRTARLLDSMLAGYPIGTLLLCQTRNPTAVLDLDRTDRRAKQNETSWQILDGQQRIIALTTLFAGDEPSGEPSAEHRFFLNLSAPRPELNVGKKDERIKRYIIWKTAFHEPFEVGGPLSRPDRSQWLDLARLGQWLLKTNKPLQKVRTLGTKEFKQWLKDVDPALTSIEEAVAAQARERIDRLLSRWSESWIPVQKVKLGGPDDVLQVFSRANMEGVRTSAADIFFAGVKTEWSNAEESLHKVCDQVRILRHMDALRLLARLASYELSSSDIIPLRLDRLKGDGGKRLVRKMEDLACSTQLLHRLNEASKFLIERSGLGYALRFVDPHLLDHALGCTARQSKSGHDADFKVIANYLFWGTAFRLYPVFRETFSREAMALAVKEPATAFPLGDILRYVRKTWKDLRYSRSEIPKMFDEQGDRLDKNAFNAVNARPQLFLSVGQCIPYDPESADPPHSVDWDHIYPKAKRIRMKWHGPSGKLRRLQYHYDTYLVWRAGNLCGLDSSINRKLQDKGPHEKLEQIETLRAEGSLWPGSIFMTQAQADLLRKTETMLGDKEKVPAAMQSFKKFVRLRERRLFEVADRIFPLVSDFRDVLFSKGVDE